MCTWEDCECTADTPLFSRAATNPYHYFVLAIVLVLAYPLIRGFKLLFENYLIAPLPDTLHDVLARRRPSSRYTSAEATAEDDDETPAQTSHASTTSASCGRSTPADDNNETPESSNTPNDAAESSSTTELVQKRDSETDRPSSPTTINVRPRRSSAQTLFGTSNNPTTAGQRRRVSTYLTKYDIASDNSSSDAPETKDAEARHALYRRKLERGSQHTSEDRKATIVRQVRKMAPIVVDQVLAQLEELETLRASLKKRRDADLVARLASHVRRRWGWTPSFNVFIMNVEERLLNEMALAYRWHEDIQGLAMSMHGADLDALVARKLHEFERVARMTRLEKAVYYACVDRTNCVVVPPQRAPSLPAYVLAWIVTAGAVAGVCYVLISTASRLGRKQSALWLAHLIITGTLTYGLILPVEIYAFYVFMPDLLWDRLMARTPGSLKKFPYKTPQPPYALRFLLDLNPVLRDHVEAPRLVYGVVDHDGAPLALDDIYAYETWKPPIDTRLLLLVVGFYSSLPDFFQQVFFEEVLSFSPYLSAVVTETTLDWAQFPRQFRSAAVLVIATFLVFLAYGALHGLRIVLRRTFKEKTPRNHTPTKVHCDDDDT